MIHCPNCGTSNRKGSRFCSECGKALTSTGIQCPACNTVNPVANVFCQACSARLTPVAEPNDEEADENTKPIKGISLPTIPLDESGGERESPFLETGDQEESSAADWLDELRESAEQEQGMTEDDEVGVDRVDVDEPPVPADIPDWLSELGPVNQTPQAPTDSEPPALLGAGAEQAATGDEISPKETPSEGSRVSEEASALPPTDRSPSERETAPPAAEETPPERAEIPDWLRDLGPITNGASPFADDKPLGTEETAPEEPHAEKPDLEQAPDWLRDVTSANPETSAPDESTPSTRDEVEISGLEPEAIEIPDWLREAETGGPPHPPQQVSREEPSVAEEPQGREALSESAPSLGPSWEPSEAPSLFRESEPSEAPPEEPISPFTKAPPEDVETPDWLTDLMVESPAEEDEAEPFSEGPAVTEGMWRSDLERADIPNWLEDLRPGEDAADERLGPVETEGLLRGLRGLIPASSLPRPSGGLEGLPPPGTSEASLARAELLQSLLGQPAVKPRPEPRERKGRGLDLAERWGVVGLLMLTVLAVLLAPMVTGRRLQLTEPMAVTGASDLHRLVEGLEHGQNVLMAVDYGPPEADELSLAARPVLEHVLARGATISVVSTRPDGTLAAAALVEDVADSDDQYELIGYRAGAATAVSQLLAASDNAPALLLILTSRPVPFRVWIEQAKAHYGEDLPVAAVASSALEPITAPYTDPSAGQLRAAIHGLRGGASYGVLRGTDDRAAQRLDALAAGHAVIVISIVIGAVFHAFAGTGEEGE